MNWVLKNRPVAWKSKAVIALASWVLILGLGVAFFLADRFISKLGLAVGALVVACLMAHFVSNAIQRIISDQLREAQRQNELILNSSGEGIYGLDISGKITFVNPSAARTIGWAVHELTGQSEHDVLRHANSAGSPYGAGECPICGDFFQGKPFFGRDEILRRKDGTSFHGEYARTPILENGRLIGGVVIFKDITEQKKAAAELLQLNQRLQDASRRAGMEEVATGVLHNVGNVLNSVNVSVTLLDERVRQIRISSLRKIAALLREHAGDWATFLANDPKAKVLPGYLAGLAEYLSEDQKEMRKEMELLIKNVNHIKDIISRQQSFGRSSGLVEWWPLASLVEDSLEMVLGTDLRRDIQVVREFAELPPVAVDKHRILQILVNLLRNAKQSIRESGQPSPRLNLRIRQADAGRVRIEIGDNGMGIRSADLTRIFAHGFTTKSEGHGFGLHSSAIAAQEMGGTLTAHSPGPGQGATFILEFPCGKERPVR